MSEPEEVSRDELIVVVRRQADRIAAQDQQITVQAGQLAELMEVNEALAGKLARLEHLLSRNSGNSSMPPSKDDDPGRTPPPPKRAGGGKRSRGKQPGAPGSHLAWTNTPDEVAQRFPQGSCECAADLGGARDLGVVDRYQQHEIPRSGAESGDRAHPGEDLARQRGCTANSPASATRSAPPSGNSSTPPGSTRQRAERDRPGRSS